MIFIIYALVVVIVFGLILGAIKFCRIIGAGKE